MLNDNMGKKGQFPASPMSVGALETCLTPHVQVLPPASVNRKQIMMIVMYGRFDGSFMDEAVVSDTQTCVASEFIAPQI